MMSSRITIEDVVRLPTPGQGMPVRFRFSPDDALLTYLDTPDGRGEGLTRRLFGRPPRAGGVPGELFGGSVVDEAELSLEETLRRERERQRGLGVTTYFWAREGTRIFVPTPGGLVVLGPGAEPRLAVAGPAQAPKASSDGRLVAFVRDDEVHVADVDGRDVRPVTSGARAAGVTHGLAEFVAQEEMSRRDGFWWSPDARRIAFARVDERHIPLYRIAHQGKDDPLHEDHRYPFAGADNARVELGVVPVSGGEPVWCDLGDDRDVYLARAGFLPDGAVVAQILDRRQHRLTLLRIDPDTGTATSVLVEESDVWINLHDVFHPLESGGFLWASERTGFRHLYRCSADGREQLPLTSGDWMITALHRVDEAAGLAYVTATKRSPLERHLYRVALDGSAEPVRLTPEPGTHVVELDHGCRAFVDVHSDIDRPPVAVLRSLRDGSVIDTLCPARDDRVGPLGLRPPELMTFETSDAETLHGAFYAPDDAPGTGPPPLVVSVYGGPHAQRVTRSWGMTTDMRAQYLRSRGVAVFVCDNRGSANRGLAFESAVRWNLGDLEVSDQAEGVAMLVGRGLVSGRPAGIYGWSYGGYMALMGLARAPQVFGFGVSGAPVTHWDGYDTCYTERYMGLPQENPDGYRVSSVMAHVKDLAGELLLVHGMIDENVHFRHTARLVNALNRAEKPYDLLIFPDERHVPRRPADRAYMERRVTRFLLDRAGIQGADSS